MGGRHRARFEMCGVEFVDVLDKECSDESVLKASIEGKEFDFAVIASPASTHYAYAKFFLERKIPVFVEKPLATAGEEAQELVDLATKNDTLLFVAQSECYNPIFLNFRKHFLAELNGRVDAGDELPAGSVRLEFRREHRRSDRCRDVNVALDLLVHDLSLFLTLFRAEDLKVEWFKTGTKSARDPADFDSAMLRLSLAHGLHKGVIADFYVNRNSNCDVRTITVDFARIACPDGQGGIVPETSYTVSLARYTQEGGIDHVPDSLDNEHRFFLKLLAGACGEWGRRAAQNAADCVKIACAT
jgi:predicted dehydrogenase